MKSALILRLDNMDNHQLKFTINARNQMQLVERQLPPTTRQLAISAPKGHGCAVLQLTRSYNVPMSSISSISVWSPYKVICYD